MKLRRCNKTAVGGKFFALCPDKFVCRPVTEPRTGTLGRFDHLDLLWIITVASNDGAAAGYGVCVEGYGFRVHAQNIQGTMG